MGPAKPSSSKRNVVRIIGGELRSRHISFPDGEGLRPTADRIRETLFNWLQDEVAGSRCLDLFAGSGALGFEALSRGASCLDAVELDAKAVQSIKDNIAGLDIENASVHKMTCIDWINRNDGKQEAYDLIFLDPPYAANLLSETCERLQSSSLLAKSCKIYMENAEPLQIDSLPATWEIIKEKKSGQVYYYLVQANSGD